MLHANDISKTFGDKKILSNIRLSIHRGEVVGLVGKNKIIPCEVLLQDPVPTILLLDEPTNNLDLEEMLWLTEFITSLDGAVLITSHDRYFL